MIKYYYILLRIAAKYFLFTSCRCKCWEEHETQIVPDIWWFWHLEEV